MCRQNTRKLWRGRLWRGPLRFYFWWGAHAFLAGAEEHYDHEQQDKGTAVAMNCLKSNIDNLLDEQLTMNDGVYYTHFCYIYSSILRIFTCVF